MKKLASLRFSVAAIAPLALIALSPRTAHAVDVVAVDQKPVTLDVTETSIVSQQFDARTAQGELIQDHGYGSWINRLNLALKWTEWTVGMRLDSSVYWRRPLGEAIDAACGPGQTAGCFTPNQLNNIAKDDASRYRNYIYPAKVFAKYQSKNLEVTVGDAYVQFGRGLVLSLRKVDELGIDTTVRGAKLTYTQDPFAVTLVAGILNPTKIDEASGRALVLPHAVANDPAHGIMGDSIGPQPIFGSDRVVGAQIQAGRGLPVVLSTHGARFTRCAPLHYQADGSVADGAFDTPFGSCDPSDTAIWLATLPGGQTPTISASEIFMGGQSLEIPSLWKHGNLYVEAAVQHRHHDDNPNDATADGNALYAALTTNAGAFTSTLELKRYRNFYGVTGSANTTFASAFSGVAYTNVPSGEVATQDSFFGFFNACVDGGRLRTDYRLTPELLVYIQGIYAFSRSELGAGCDQFGNSVGTPSAAPTKNRVFDGLAGLELLFDNDTSHFFASGGGRDDTKDNGDFYYDEVHVEYTLSKHISGPYSVELSGRERFRKEEQQNVRTAGGTADWWHQGEDYVAMKIAPKWVFGPGLEYTTQLGFPTTYWNGSVLYRFTSDSNIRVFAGQQRGGLKCVSGICKVFPAYEGGRVELTVRF